MNVLISEGSKHSSVVMLFLPGLELLRHGRVSRSLKLLNLISVEAIVIENLPLLGRTLISLDATFSDSLGSNDIFDPVLHLNEHFFHARIVIETSDSAVVKDQVLLVVVIIVVLLTRSELDSQLIHLILLAVKRGPELTSHLLRVDRGHGLGGALNVIIVSAPSREVSMDFRLLAYPRLRLSNILIVQSLLNF